MKKIILPIFVSLLLFSLVGAVGQQDIFVLNLQYNQGNVSLNSLIVTNGVFYPPVSIPQEGYNISLISANNKTIYSQIFDFNLVIHRSPPDPSWFDDKGNQISFGFGSEEKDIILDSVTAELILPYSQDVAYIEIKNKSNVKILLVMVKDNSSISNATNTIPCIIVSCTYAPQTCPKWGTQERTCLDSCTKQKVKEKINCTPGARIGSVQEVGFWQKIGLWFKGIFS